MPLVHGAGISPAPAAQTGSIKHPRPMVSNACPMEPAQCLIAHLGWGEGYTCYNVHLLDELRKQVPIDGFEAYYPAHTPEQIVMYREYAQKHRLLTSSDSHGPEKKPIKYRAELSSSLLECLGIQMK
jgi:3',5'-nucleoside bisphosphate phosphatase